MQNENKVSSIMEELKAAGLASAYDEDVRKYLTLEKYALLEAYEPQPVKTAPKGSEWD